jgi:hypothetical protein
LIVQYQNLDLAQLPHGYGAILINAAQSIFGFAHAKQARSPQYQREQGQRRQDND